MWAGVSIVILTIIYLLTMAIWICYLIQNYKYDKSFMEFLILMVEMAAMSFIYFILIYMSCIYLS